jgi:hypothetical protein
LLPAWAPPALRQQGSDYEIGVAGLYWGFHRLLHDLFADKKQSDAAEGLAHRCGAAWSARCELDRPPPERLRKLTPPARREQLAQRAKSGVGPRKAARCAAGAPPRRPRRPAPRTRKRASQRPAARSPP